MTTDATRPLAPLNPKDTAKLGPPEVWTYPRSGDHDISICGWTIGKGNVHAPGTGEANIRRGTTVTINLTTTGRLVTTKNAWTRRDDGGWESDLATGQVHETPGAVPCTTPQLR